MKILKPLTCLLFLSFVLASCSNDDNAVLDNTGEKIIGTWHLSEIVEDGESILLGPCLPQSTVKFEEGVFTSNAVSEGFDGECVEEETLTGQWEYLGNNQFAIIEGGEENIAEIVFSEEDTVFSMTDGGDEGSIAVISFIKTDQ